MPGNFQLTVVTPEQVVFDSPARSLIAPGGAGYLGVLVGHAPLLTTLVSGKLTVTDPQGRREEFRIGPGFMDVMANQVTVLTQDFSPLTPKRDIPKSP